MLCADDDGNDLIGARSIIVVVAVDVRHASV